MVTCMRYSLHAHEYMYNIIIIILIIILGYSKPLQGYFSQIFFFFSTGI